MDMFIELLIEVDSKKSNSKVANQNIAIIILGF